jgi:hypothetical protein
MNNLDCYERFVASLKVLRDRQKIGLQTTVMFLAMILLTQTTLLLYVFDLQRDLLALRKALPVTITVNATTPPEAKRKVETLWKEYSKNGILPPMKGQK